MASAKGTAPSSGSNRGFVAVTLRRAPIRPTLRSAAAPAPESRNRSGEDFPGASRKSLRATVRIGIFEADEPVGWSRAVSRAETRHGARPEEQVIRARATVNGFVSTTRAVVPRDATNRPAGAAACAVAGAAITTARPPATRTRCNLTRRKTTPPDHPAYRTGHEGGLSDRAGLVGYVLRENGRRAPSRTSRSLSDAHRSRF
jgi:hypothetical protein